MVEIISNVLYNSELKSALTFQDRTVWRGLGLPKPRSKVPVLFLDLPGMKSRTSILSWTNEQEVAAAIKNFKKIQAIISRNLILLCHYSLTLRNLKPIS